LRSQTIRLGIFISTLIITAIITFQLIWLKKVYNYEERQFDHSIVRVIRGYYEDVHLVPDSSLLLSTRISKLNSETYLVKIDKPKNYDSLAFFIHEELEEENIYTDCYMGIYDSDKKNYVLLAYLPPKASSGVKVNAKNIALPSSYEPYHHLTLYFPHKAQFILSEMNFWLISSAVLLIVLVLFGGSIYYFYRQKFLNETQKDFVNNFTHEFKTPVAVINLAAEVLANPDIGKKPERLSRYASIVSYQGKYLQNQIEQLLRFAYSESNHMHLNKEKVSFHELIEESINNLQPLIDEKQASINFDLSAERDVLLADHGYLLIVVTNLIENALKYSKEPKIIIHTFNENGHVVLSVKDNGKGIEKKYFNKIFRKFYRIPNGDQMSTRGFGLGLSFVKRIIDSHHGRINIESIPGIGSNFIVKLPVA
jgi:two-component system phosphate regulon sensor histidine kinase PhoR